eukprot:TRINITY_DN2833_c1_g2_i1.p1 TRINITY_DN2833_c1_g2~~TRINITY_DN2833_c1_g2_i1.p1  ORF type:complete len:711 (+),score=336.32 TRINITY_DN2833_c1_g2_i1:47-2179(+)
MLPYAWYVVALLAISVVAAEEKKEEKNDAKEKIGTVIGIDLGTTFSCVGVQRNGKVEIFENDQGSRTTPSYVAFTPEGARLVGEAAKNQGPLNPTNTIYDVKRLIGRNYKERSVQADIKQFPFTVISKAGQPHIQVEFKGKKETFACQQISAMVLKHMKEIAEAKLDEEVKYAVVTVPAYFNDAQRQATKAAGEIAGLKVLRIINEPTAAAIAYGLDPKSGDDKKILVYDLGGGTFDVSVLTIDSGVFEVGATNGDTHLGGEDFDLRVTNHFAKIFNKKTGQDVTKSRAAFQKLKRAVEKAKIALSSVAATKIELDNLMGGEDFSETLTRARFESLNNDLFKKTLVPVKKVLEDANMEKEDVDEIVLVGGSTRIPKVRKLISEFFDGKEPSTGVDPDEAVAWGAAAQGALLSDTQESKGFVLVDVTPLTLGMEDEDGIMVKIIDRNTPIPVKKTSPFTTVVDNQRSVLFKVYEGERTLAKYNHQLGEFTLKVPPAPKGVPEILVTFELDVNGILHVNAKDTGTGNQKSIKITSDRNKLSESEMQKMIEDAERFEEEDKKLLEAVAARNELDNYASSVKSSLIEYKKNLDKKDRKKARKAVNKVLKWLTTHRREDPSVYEKKKEDLEEIVGPIVAKLYRQDKDNSDDEREREKMFSDDEEADVNEAKMDEEAAAAAAGEYDDDLDKVEEEPQKVDLDSELSKAEEAKKKLE